jgi:hypothetical protein
LYDRCTISSLLLFFLFSYLYLHTQQLMATAINPPLDLPPHARSP